MPTTRSKTRSLDQNPADPYAIPQKVAPAKAGKDAPKKAQRGALRDTQIAAPTGAQNDASNDLPATEFREKAPRVTSMSTISHIYNPETKTLGPMKMGILYQVNSGTIIEHSMTNDHAKSQGTVPREPPLSILEDSCSDDSVEIVSDSCELDRNVLREPKSKSNARPASRPALRERSANIGANKTSAPEKKVTISAKEAKTVDDLEESEESDEEVMPMPDEERRRIFKTNKHWEPNDGGFAIRWDDDIRALADEELRLEDHTLLVKGLAAKVANAWDDDEKIIAKVKAAGGWYGDLIIRGEEDKTIPIYDSCFRLREKIRTFLEQDIKKPENYWISERNGKRVPRLMDQKAFCSVLGTSPASLNDFMKKAEVMGGAESGIYIPAYCFFEKKRMWEGEQKSLVREQTEKLWWPKGLQRKESNRDAKFLAKAKAEGLFPDYII